MTQQLLWRNLLSKISFEFSILNFEFWIFFLDPIRGPVRDPVRGPVRSPVRGPVRDLVRDPVQVLSTPIVMQSSTD